MRTSARGCARRGGRTRPRTPGWSLGTDLAYLRELVGYWADEFDWPAQETALGQFPRFRVALGGLGIHFVHVRATAPAGPVLPLILSHGWPDSFWRYTKVIPLLTDPGAHGADPADAFDVVVPDMPGYGYSDRPVGPPLDSIAVASLWAQLMGVLGYTRFGAAGGDIGGQVSRYLALDYPERVVAVHRTDAGVSLFTGDPADLSPDERASIEAAAAWGATEGAYAAIHRTKPQTAAFGLTDSPAGLAAWIVEKLQMRCPRSRLGWLADHRRLTPGQIDQIDQAFRKRVQAVQSVDDMIASIQTALPRTTCCATPTSCSAPTTGCTPANTASCPAS